MGQDGGAHALCGVHAEVEALGGGDGLSGTHQVGLHNYRKKDRDLDSDTYSI